MQIQRIFILEMPKLYFKLNICAFPEIWIANLSYLWIFVFKMKKNEIIEIIILYA